MRKLKKRVYTCGMLVTALLTGCSEGSAPINNQVIHIKQEDGTSKSIKTTQQFETKSGMKNDGKCASEESLDNVFTFGSSGC